MKETKKWRDFVPHNFSKYVVLSILITFVLEILNRRSLIECLKFIVQSPITFIYNIVIVFLTLSIAWLTKRKIFTVSIITLIWMIIGIINCIVLGYRTTPFSAIDTLMITNVISMYDVYFNIPQIIAIIAAFLVVIAGLVFLWIRAPKEKSRFHLVYNVLIITVLVVGELVFTQVCIKAEILSNNFENLAYAYENYGFAYCFTNSIVDIGISEPKDYSEETVEEIAEPIASSQDSDVETSTTDYTNVKPNIIVIQLESFFDVNYINDVTFSENPVPNFEELKENYTSGFLTVPCVGAGTANTEFEVLTGMSTAFFGAGEYPYKTIMTETTTESMAYLLKNSNYATHAIHNNDGTFYSRNVVFSNLGFDTFTPIEYMYNIETTPLGWAKDNVLPGEILKSMNSTEDRDFVFTVSVQGHGRYPSDVTDDNATITSSGNDTKKAELEYYVNEIHEMDEMLGTLIDDINESGEPTILVLYGDHLPTLGLTDERLENEDLYQTEYVIWDNIGLDQEDEDIYSYQLSTKIFETLGYDLGIMQEFHKNYADSDDYQKDMEILEYDMLYGDNYIYDDQTDPYEATDLQMGIDEIKIDSIKKIKDTKDSYTITGENFNEYSLVYVNDKLADTEYVDENTLKITGTALEKGDSVSIGQTGEDRVVLGYSNELIVS